jgi:hypothetical protein
VSPEQKIDPLGEENQLPPSIGNCARYNAGSPIAHPQSLAKRIAFECNSHAGYELLQFPPVRGCVFAVTTFRSQTCFGPVNIEVYAIHFPSGETAESAAPVDDGKDRGPTVPVEGSNCMIVEVPCATSSK